MHKKSATGRTIKNLRKWWTMANLFELVAHFKDSQESNNIWPDNVFAYSNYVESSANPFSVDIMDRPGINKVRVPSKREIKLSHEKSSLFDNSLLTDVLFCIFTCTFYIVYLMYFLIFLFCWNIFHTQSCFLLQRRLQFELFQFSHIFLQKISQKVITFWG